MCTTVMIVYVFFVYYKNTHTQIITQLCAIGTCPTYYAKQRSLGLAMLSQPHARTDVQQFYDYVCIFVFHQQDSIVYLSLCLT